MGGRSPHSHAPRPRGKSPGELKRRREEDRLRDERRLRDEGF
ncbi:MULTISPECIES: hypothetical protein [unclassified Streptomyces]